MKSLTTAVFAAMLTLGTTAAFAQASGAMGNDAMSHDAMSKSGMSHDTMGKSGMSHDSMKKSNKMKKHDAMGMEHGAMNQ
ncbi:MAG TPA: pentapeptide MXKDX repeat protein [Paraburkholderia sp.]|uniref:pentapeptide MXKDX repeat protein n=1 Tax=Paraburkholderia sp. TaxID=1926495 RepID=UPI002ED189E6